MIDKRGRKGYFDIKVFRDGKLFKHDIIKNTLMDAVLNKEINILLGTAPDLQIKYAAFGTDDTAVTVLDTTLGSEQLRIQPTTAFANVSTGKVQGGFFLSSSDLVGVDIEEIGIFCGSGATASADSGTLLSRILWSFSKTASDEIEITRVDQIERS